jgi:hypothetical protein
LLKFHELGMADQRTRLADRAVAHVRLEDYSALASLLIALRHCKATKQLARLADRAMGHADLTSAPDCMVILLQMLPKAIGKASGFANRAAAEMPLDDPWLVAEILATLCELDTVEQVALLLARAPATHVHLKHPGVTKLLKALHEIGATEEMTRLADRATTNASLGDPSDVADLLRTLYKVGADQQVNVLLARDPATHVELASAYGAVDLLRALTELADTDQLTRFAERVVHMPLEDSRQAAALQKALNEVGTEDQVRLLAGRATALREARADDQAARPGEHLPAQGAFYAFMKIGDHQTRFRFGREPDGTPATPWGWDDLY